jgi:hypothetical protein
MMSRHALVLIASLLAPNQAPAPVIELVTDQADGVGFETYAVAADGTRTLTARHVLPAGSRFPVKVDGRINLIEFSNRNRPPLAVPMADLALADVWHLERRGAADVFIWSGAARLGRFQSAATVVTAETAACANADTFLLGVISTYGIRAAIPFLRTNEIARCRWVFLGLPAGQLLQASLRSELGSSGRREFRVVPKKTTEVTIPPPAVTLSGVITLNGKPIADGMAQFRRAPETWAVDLQPGGSYQVTFDHEGDYTLALLRPLSRFKPVTLTLARGANTFDWNIEDPSADSELRVRVTDHDRTEDIEIEIQTDGKPIAGGLIRSGHESFSRTGLAFGKYRVAARQPTGASDWQDVELSAEAPSAAVTLSIVRGVRSITLRYVDGEPVISAGFGFSAARPQETVPGTYSLSSIAPNTELLIRAPSGAPICRVVPTTGDLEATVSPGRALTLRFENRRVTVNEVRIATEADCPMPLGVFLKSPLRVGADSAEIEVLNGPPDEVLTIHTRDGVYQATVGPDGVVVIRAAQ